MIRNQPLLWVLSIGFELMEVKILKQNNISLRFIDLGLWFQFKILGYVGMF